MGEITKTRQQYGARVMVPDDALAYAAADIRAYVREALERQLREAGADRLELMQEQPYVHELEHPRRWWERLLRRPARTYEFRGVEFVAYGYGHVTVQHPLYDQENES